MSGYIDMQNDFGGYKNIPEEKVESFFEKCIEMSAVSDEDIFEALDSFDIRLKYYQDYNTKVSLSTMFIPNVFVANELEDIYDLITGRDSLISDDISDENGNISEDKIEELIAEIIDLYRFVKEARYYNGGPKIKEKHDEDEFYKCFLYCTLTGAFKFKKTYFSPVKKYSDIIKIAKNSVAYTSRKQILEAECGVPFFEAIIVNGCQGFFEIMARSFKWIRKKELVSIYDENDWALVSHWKEMFVSAEIGSYVPNNGIETLLDYMKDIHFRKKDIDDDTIGEAERTAVSKTEEWVNSLINPEKYIKRYLKAREIYMEYIEKDRSTIDWITRDIERMIDCYLAEKGRNYLLMSRDEEKNNENVIGIAYRMKQMTKSIERMKKREVTDRE